MCSAIRPSLAPSMQTPSSAQQVRRHRPPWRERAARSIMSPPGSSRRGTISETARPRSASSRRTPSRRASRWRNSGRSCLNASELEIAFAHRTFAWGSDARGKAHVHVVIIGLDPAGHGTTANNGCSATTGCERGTGREPASGRLAAYLFDGGPPQGPSPGRSRGNQPLDNRTSPTRYRHPAIDGGLDIFTDDEKAAFLRQEPGAAEPFLTLCRRPGLIHGKFAGDPPFPGAVRPKCTKKALWRSATGAPSYPVPSCKRAEANRPGARQHAHSTRGCSASRAFLVIPEVSSERREYVPSDGSNHRHTEQSRQIARGR